MKGHKGKHPLTSYGPDPIIPAEITMNKPIPELVWTICRVLNMQFPLEDWHIVAFDNKGRKRQRSFKLGERRFAAIWMTENYYRGWFIQVINKRN